MSEKVHIKAEHHEAPKASGEHHERLRHSVETKAEKSRNEHSENLDDIRASIEKEAKSKHESHKAHSGEKSASNHPMFINRELKNMAFNRTLRRTQSKLPAPARAFSKVIHQPVVEAVSDAAGKTIARPSGMLLGGIFAFVGSSIFLWVSRHYGYEYNFLLFLAFFIGGFFIGLLVELGIFAANRKSK